MADVTAASKAVATLPALWACCKTIFEAFCDNLVHQCKQLDQREQPKVKQVPLLIFGMDAQNRTHENRSHNTCYTAGLCSSLYWHSFYLYWLSKCMQQTKHNAMQVRSNNADIEAAAYSDLHINITDAFTLFQQWERKPTPTNMHSMQSLYLERTCVQFNRWAGLQILTR